MKNLILISLLFIASFALACSGAETSTQKAQTENTNRSQAASSIGHSPSDSAPPVASSHGGGAGATTQTPSASAQKPSIETPELDAKIEKAVAKAKAKGATEADKKAAAAAYVERGNVYRDAGQPSLYKFALADYRRALRFQPDNKEAREKGDEIVSIYKQMGRPVPELGNEEQ